MDQAALLLKTKDDHNVERTLARLSIARNVALVFEWLSLQRGSFSAQTVGERFPVFPMSEHIAMLKVCVQGQLLKLLSYPALPRD